MIKRRRKSDMTSTKTQKRSWSKPYVKQLQAGAAENAFDDFVDDGAISRS